MEGFKFYNPVRVIFGPGALKQAGSEIAKIGRKALLVSYQNPAALTPVLEAVQRFAADAGVAITPFFSVTPNPEICLIEAGVSLAKKQLVDCIVGVGGGSAMDAAKAVAAGFYYQGNLWNMVYHRHDASVTIPPELALPMLMIPTLPASGSEMNMCAVISNDLRREKSYIWAECLFPKTAILDPELTVDLPPFQAACAAADTISHVLEIYLNGQGSAPVQNYFQEGIMRTVIEHIRVVLKSPNNIESRGHLQWAAACAINGWASPGDAWAPIHQLGHVLTARHGIAHGAALAVLLPAWMETFESRRPEMYLRFARRVMDADAYDKTDAQIIDAGIGRFRQFLLEIGMPPRLRDFHVSDRDLAEIVADVVRVSFNADGMLKCNPPVSREDVMNVLRTAL